MKIRARCKICHGFTKEIIVSHDNMPLDHLSALCAKGHTVSLQFEDFLNDDSCMQLCPVCLSPDAFICKDVQRKSFFLLTVFGLFVAFVLLFQSWWIGMSVLFLMSAVDLAMYRMLPNMVVCYGCQSEFRNLFMSNKLSYKAFDHHVAERYRARGSMS